MDNKNKNIVLIGMSGCGKTCIGKLLSKKLNMRFVDLDNFIEKTSGHTISEIFSQGEENFRDLETKAVIEFSETSSTIISTGGGVINRSINIEKLKENGLIIFIDRPIKDIAEDIDFKNRPLLKDGVHNLYKLYNERFEIYKSSADIVVKNDGNIRDFLKKLLKYYYYI